MTCAFTHTVTQPFLTPNITHRLPQPFAQSCRHCVKTKVSWYHFAALRVKTAQEHVLCFWPFAPMTVEGVWGRSKIGMGCGATKMYLSSFFAKKPMKASHRRSKTTVNERAFLHAVDLCSTVSRKTESKPIWFPGMSKTRQPAYPRNSIFKKTKCACAMEEIETSNGNHSIRQRLPSRKAA